MNHRKKRFEYLVRWTGYDETTWEPIDSVGETAAVDEYHAAYPDRPKPAGFL
jgi:hypothetical protein